MNKKYFLKGFRDAIPVGLGYLAVSFSLGIACQRIGMNSFQGFLISLLNNASAGEYAGIKVISDKGGIITMIIMMLVANARYLLMSCALSQKLSPDLHLGHRLLIGFDVTDELFGLAVSCDGYLKPAYFYGAMCCAMPPWALGTVLGIIVGNLLPQYIVSGFSVMLYGMFIAIIIPQGKKDKVVLGCIISAFALSGLMEFIPVLSGISSGFKIIILTLLISAVAAVCFPKKEDEA